MSLLPFKIRMAGEEDSAFIANAWRGTMIGTCPAARGAEPKQFHGEMTRLLERLKRAGCTFVVAHDHLDATNLVGFAAYTGPELHYVYTPFAFRSVGVVPMLLDGVDIKRFTFQTPSFLRRIRPRERGWIFTPRFTI